MRKGDVALFNAYTPHRGTLNTTFEGPNAVRWSLDLRYQKAGTPTGRPHWPAFVVQSADAAREQRGFEEWRARWDEGLRSPLTDAHRAGPGQKAQVAKVPEAVLQSAEKLRRLA